ncbi:MAG: dienelactone hydrolase family protein [Actinomycetota bacterium]
MPGWPAPAVERDEISIAVEDGAMPALVARPKGKPEAAGVVIIADIRGRSPFYEDLAARLATAGFRTVLPEFFFREGPLPDATRDAMMARRAKLDEERSLRDFHAALDTLGNGRKGLIGFCMGGTLVLDLAAERDDLASVCYYGYPAGSRSMPKAARAPLDRVDSMKGPILGFWGDQDEGAGMHNVESLVKAVRDRGEEFDHMIYPGIGHGFLAASRLEPDEPMYEPACDSWTRAVEFFRDKLYRS